MHIHAVPIDGNDNALPPADLAAAAQEIGLPAAAYDNRAAALSAINEPPWLLPVALSGRRCAAPSWVRCGRLQAFVNPAFNIAFRCRADFRGSRLTVLENHHGRNGAHPISGRRLGIFINIDFDDGNFAGIFIG